MYACMDSTASLINNHHQNPKLHVYLVQQPQNVYPVTQTPKKQRVYSITNQESKHVHRQRQNIIYTLYFSFILIFVFSG